MSAITLSCRAAVGGGISLGNVKPPDWDICWTVDHLGTCVIEFYMGHIVFTSVLLPCGGVLVCTHVSMIKLPYQTTMRRTPILMCMLLGAHGLL
jgi:hypothetical protein